MLVGVWYDDLTYSIRKKVSSLKIKNIIKISVISVIAIVLLLSIGKNLNLTSSNNLLAKFINHVFNREETYEKNTPKSSAEVVSKDIDNITSSTNTENKDKVLSSTIADNEENRIFEEISKQHYGIKVISQNDNVKSKYYKFKIHNISTSKKLGNFNYCDDLGHIDKDGNTIDNYSYLIVSTTIECFELDTFSGQLSLKNLQIYFYNNTKWDGGTELLTANVNAPMNSKSALMVKMKKGEKRDFNLVFLVEDKFINDKAVDFYLYINEHGASHGSNDEYKSLVKLDYVRETENNNEQNRIFEEISKQQYGIKVITQNDVIETAYNRYTINKISTSKKLGDFNYSDNLGHVDKDGNAIEGYSYFIVNTSLECLDVDEVIGGFYLNTIHILAYKDTIQQTGYEMLTSNNDVPMSNKSAFKVKMKKGEKRDFNLVFLVEDKFINDKGVDFYLDINDRGASPGSDDENKRIVKLDYVR